MLPLLKIRWMKKCYEWGEYGIVITTNINVFVLFVFAVECFMPNVACVSGLFLFSFSSLLSVLCPMSLVSLDYFCFVCLRCWVFYDQCRLCLWIVFVLFVFAVECFMPNVACVPGLLFLFFFYIYLLCLWFVSETYIYNPIYVHTPHNK